MKLVARVPATVANLGPGFDAFGLALTLYNEIEVDTEAEPAFQIDGEGEGELATDDSNLVLRAIGRVYSEWRHYPPKMAVRCSNGIPLERGLGSSAAAAVGGLVLADRLVGTPLGADALLQLAVELEGHADNAAAALHGGAVIAYTGDDRAWRAEALDPAPGLRPVVLVPKTERVRTEDARRVLDERVLRADATFNASRAAMLSIALTRRPDLLRVAMQDRLHQERRLELASEAKAIFEQLRAAHVPVCVAGSGPTLLAFETDDVQVPEPGDRWEVLRLEVDRKGAEVLEPA